MSHTLTPEQEQARGELMAHIARKPRPDEFGDLATWRMEKEILEGELAKAMAAGPAPPLLQDVPPAPKVVAAPEPRAKRHGPAPKDPQVRLDNLLKMFRESTGVVRSNAKQRIKMLCREAGLPIPEELDIPVPTGAAAHAKPSAQVAPPPQMQEPTVPQPEPSSGLDRSHELAIDLGRSIERYIGRPEHLSAIRATISDIRAKTWSLLAALEQLTPEQLAQLADDLKLLDAAAHTALVLGEGRAA